MEEEKIIDTTVGRQLRLARLTSGLSQKELGALVGITFQQIQKYEKGVNRVGAGRLWVLSKILGVDVNYFYDQTCNRTPVSRRVVAMYSNFNMLPESTQEAISVLIKGLRRGEAKL